MKLSDRLLTVWIYAIGVGLSLLGMTAYALDWALVVQLALPALLIVVPLATERAITRARRRR